MHMHDWTLMSLKIDWIDGKATVALRNERSEEVFLSAHGIYDVRVSRREEWGPSVSINEVVGPVQVEGGRMRIAMEVQSGDKIEIEAEAIFVPPDQRDVS